MRMVCLRLTGILVVNTIALNKLDGIVPHILCTQIHNL